MLMSLSVFLSLSLSLSLSLYIRIGMYRPQLACYGTQLGMYIRTYPSLLFPTGAIQSSEWRFALTGYVVPECIMYYLLFINDTTTTTTPTTTTSHRLMLAHEAAPAQVATRTTPGHRLQPNVRGRYVT